MMSAPWTSLPALSLDTESTGLDVFNDRIVELAAVEVLPNGDTHQAYAAIVDPGLEVPDEAAAVHGITTERARAEGIAPDKALSQLALRVWEHIETYETRAAIVIMNARFDLPLLISECARHGVEWPPFAGILDPLVIDRKADWYRKDQHHFQAVADTYEGGWEEARDHRYGRRTLVDLAARYGVEFGTDDAHGALADATASGRVLWAETRRFPKMASNSLAALWLKQVHGAEKDHDRLQHHFRSTGDPLAEVVGGWPLPARAEKSAKPKTLATAGASA